MLQSIANLQRRIFVKPSELELGHDEFLQLVLPLYGTSESGDYWGEALTDHFLTRENLTQNPGDLSLFYKRLTKDLCVLSGNYVDDILRAAPKEHRAGLESTLHAQIECSVAKNLPTDSLGYELSRSSDDLHAAMQVYVECLKPLNNGAKFKQYSALEASLVWLSHARPDVAAFSRLAYRRREVDKIGLVKASTTWRTR